MRISTVRALSMALSVSLLVGLGAAPARAELDSKAIKIQPLDAIKWVRAPNGGSESAVIFGDPSKPGLYVVLQKWLPHHNSHPHFHPNDRFITVLAGTWWVNTGPKYDPDGMQPVHAGSVVTHFGKQIHYDGAKDEECILEIVGMGPATATAAEEK